MPLLVSVTTTHTYHLLVHMQLQATCIQFTVYCIICISLQWFDTVVWGAGRASVCKKTEWWGAGVVICLERDTDLHMAQLMPLPLTVSCFSKIQLGFTFLVPAHLGSPGKRTVKGVCVSITYMLKP